jgi:hypothetical protein
VSLDVVDRQLGAYNSHDLEAFLACYSPDVQVRNRQGKTLMDGRAAVRREYDEWFTSHPEVHAESTGRLVSGEWVVDEEHVTMADATISALVAYHVADGLIDEVLLLAEGS